MESEYDAAFNLIENSLLLAPPATLISFFAVRRWWPSALRVLSWACLIIFCAILCCMILGLSLTKNYDNFLCFDVGFISYCFWAASCVRIRSVYRRVVALILASLPIFFGYLLGTVGILGLAFEIDDDTETPDSVQLMGPGLTCVTSEWGILGNAGKRYDLYKQWDSIPFIQRDVEHGSSSDDDPNDKEFPITCDGLVEAYQK